MGEVVHSVRTADGHVLTEADLDALAEEAERGYDVSQMRRRYVGRPSLGNGISPRLSFRTDPELYEAARKRAAREGRSLSDLAREALRVYVRER